jgi:hypothetical protein
MAKQTPEGRVKDTIKKVIAAELPDTFTYMPVSNGMGSNGIPDFVCCVPAEITPDMVGRTIGVFVGIEAKTMTGKLSPLQRDKLEKILTASGAACIVWGSDDAHGKLTTLFDTIHQPLNEAKPK